LTAAAANAQVSLSWSAASGASSYKVKRSTVSGGPYTTIQSGLTSTSFTNTGLTNGTTYFYVVTAVNSTGESVNSNQASATPKTLSPSACRDATTTGVPPGTHLTPIDSLVITAPGTYSGYDVMNGVEIRSPNVVLENSLIRTTNGDGVTIHAVENVLIRDSEIGGGLDGTTIAAGSAVLFAEYRENVALSGAGARKLLRVHIHHVGDGARADGYGTIQDSFIHALSYQEGDHSDGSQNSGWPHFAYIGNTIEGGLTSGILLQANGDPTLPPSNDDTRHDIFDVAIDNNCFLGRIEPTGSATAAIYTSDQTGGVSDVRVTNNRFARTGLGTAVLVCGTQSPFTAFSGNTYIEDGAPILSPDNCN
jgi:hypothetical protein